LLFWGFSFLFYAEQTFSGVIWVYLYAGIYANAMIAVAVAAAVNGVCG
jgi:hypothetical protein